MNNVKLLVKYIRTNNKGKITHSFGQKEFEKTWNFSVSENLVQVLRRNVRAWSHVWALSLRYQPADSEMAADNFF